MSLETNFDWKIVYISQYNEKKLKIFGKEFVKNNKDKCIIIYRNKRYKLSEYLEIDNKSDEKEIKVRIKGIKNISGMSHMFYNCKNLLMIVDKTIENNSEINSESKDSSSESNNQTNFSDNFQNNFSDESDDSDNIYKGTKEISSIQNDNNSDYIQTNSIKDLLSDIIIMKDVTSLNHMFYGCNSLKLLPDISKWNTSNVNNMNKMFNGCNSLISLPDISKWNTSNVNNMSGMFSGCNSLSSLPDIT